MSTLFVVNHLRHWPFDIPGVMAVPARAYLTNAAYPRTASTKVYNLCKSDRYQDCGYYVSLLAEARGHRPFPDVKTIEDLQSRNLLGMLAEDLAPVLRRSLKGARSGIFELDIYFGHAAGEGHDELAQLVFETVRAPLLRIRFEEVEGRWQLGGLRVLGAGEIPSQHRQFVVQAATEFVTGQRATPREPAARQPTLAILHNADEPEPPSNPAALRKFSEAAEQLGMLTEIISRDDIDRLPEFDALFIRDTTNVNHYTYQFSRRAAASGLVVMDDPDSILKCTNKVYLNELMAQHRIAVPKTLMVHRDNMGEIVPTLGLPCILKQPDSAFSLGVTKVESEAQLAAKVNQLLEKSEFIVAQQFLPTEFDWRVGVLDGRPLFVCKYFMASGHWQIIKREKSAKLEGNTSTFSVGEVPSQIIGTAVKAAQLIGEGLYGVDLKQVGDQCYLIEVNDNPNIDAGLEDSVLEGALYREIMGVFLRRIRERRSIAA